MPAGRRDGDTEGVRGYRQDIQVLRGFAVLIVILDHAGFGPPAGFLGVDVFFVISGYLITRMLSRRIAAGSFDFGTFYFQRAKRLLPAAYVTFLVTVAVAPWFLGATELRDLAAQVLGAVTFTINYVLLSQVGYFDSGAALKPLLHIWSLAVEEQFYILFPLFLALVPPRYWRAAVAAITAGSLVACLIVVQTWPEGAFFLLPTRAWEIGIGACLALAPAVRIRAPALAGALFGVAILALVIPPLAPLAVPHPGLNALIVCAATAAIIACRHPLLDGRAARPLAMVGDASYSLYLAHWPVIAYANNAFLGPRSFAENAALLATGLVAGVVLYVLVERPLHRRRVERRRTVLVPLVAISALIAVLPAIERAMGSAAKIDFERVRAPNFGLAKACDRSGAAFTTPPSCEKAGTPMIAVWGDSFAMHIVHGLIASGPVGIVQATKSACAPALGIAQFAETSTQYNRAWAESCIAYNEAAFRYIADRDDIETVVLSSPFIQFTYRAPWQALVSDGEASEVVPMSSGIARDALVRTVAALRAAGKKAVIIGPPPKAPNDVARCIERRMSGLVTLGSADCRIAAEDDRAYYEAVLALLAEVRDGAAVRVIDPRTFLCADGACRTIAKRVPIYRDSSHFSRTGSRWFGRTSQLADRVLELAR